MLRRIAVIVVAATMLSSGPLCAQTSHTGGRAPPEWVAISKDDAIPKGIATPVPIETPKIVADRAAVEKAASDSIRVLGLQTEFPKKIEPLRIPVPEEVLWLGLAIAAALILYALRDALPFWRRASDEGWDTPAADPGAAALQRQADALAAADALSREGRFVEAMHALLLQSLADIRQQLDEQFADSLTSREILRGTKLTSHGRTSLHRIVAAVERTYFGAYPAKLDDYAACRQDFESLRYALRGGTPA
jgi:hypothetical protein